MSKKWYFRTLIATLGLLVVIQQQAVVPNQEIVLEFVDIKITSPEAQNAITTVKEQLQSIGVQHTRISKGLKNGKLKITYYSDEDVEYIKKILSEAQNVAFNHVFYDQSEEDGNEFPFNKNSKDYNLDVYKIQEGTDLSSDFNGTYVLEVPQEQNGYSRANPNIFAAKISGNDLEGLVKVARKVHADIAIAIDNTSHNIPEVRAGPIS